MLFDHHRENVLHVRGISDDVIDAWPGRYLSFAKGAGDDFLRLMLYPRNLDPKKKAAWRGKVAQTGGIVIGRSGGAPPYARFDTPVYTGPGRKTHYVYRAGYRRMHTDVHPLVVPKLEAGRSIYFCLEGSLKADAVLSTGAAVISSTAIATWQNTDLVNLLPTLREAPRVFVVPDSDFYLSEKFRDDRTGRTMFNPFVVFHTRAAAQWLATRGVKAVIAVPQPADDGSKVGVDDLLAHGGKLDELIQEQPFHDAPILDFLPLTPDQHAILAYLLRTQGPWGAFYHEPIRKAVRCNRRTVYRAVERFQELKLMRVWKGLPVELDDGTIANGPAYFTRFEISDGWSKWLWKQPWWVAKQNQRTLRRKGIIR